MADQTQLSILKQGPDAWNRWRKENPDAVIDLSETAISADEMRSADLAGANLELSGVMGRPAGTLWLVNANLKQANISHSDLGNPLWIPKSGAASSSARIACFRNADLSGCLMDCTSFQNADLRGANLSNTMLYRTNFHGADLSNANFTGAQINDAVLTKANLTDAIGLAHCKHTGPSSLDMQTLMMSGRLPENFLRGCGIPEKLIQYLSSIINDAIEFYSCFISYSHSDQSFARRLHDQLQARGIRCWLDDHQIIPGDDFYSEINRGIRIWDKVLLCCSESSLTSWWVDEEIGLAFSKERHLTSERRKKIRVLVPINLDNFIFSDRCESGKRDIICGRSAANLVGWDKDNSTFENGFEQIVRALRADLGGKDTPPEPKL